MTHILVYLVFLAACAGYALACGGAPERMVAALFAAATVLTFAAQATLKRGDFAVTETGVFLVDLALLAGLFAVMLMTTRFWTIWLVALQLVPVASHCAKLLMGPQIVPWAYAVALAVWSYPMLAILVLGTARHRERMRDYGVDMPWISPSRRMRRPLLWDYRE